jgi:hypothetical protein
VRKILNPGIHLYLLLIIFLFTLFIDTSDIALAFPFNFRYISIWTNSAHHQCVGAVISCASPPSPQRGRGGWGLELPPLRGRRHLLYSDIISAILKRGQCRYIYKPLSACCAILIKISALPVQWHWLVIRNFNLVIAT